MSSEAASTEATSTEEKVESTDELGAGEVKYIRVAGTKLNWDNTDFEISDNTVNGFSTTGLAKAQTMTEADELNFPEGVTKIAENAFSYTKFTADKLPDGIVGKVKFHKNITSIGNSAFQGNPEINEVIIEDGESIHFGVNAFDSSKVDATEEKRGNLSSLVIGKRKFCAYTRAFAFSNIKTLDFSKAIGVSYNLNPDGTKSGIENAEIQTECFYNSGVEEIVSFGDLGYINTGAFRKCDLKKVHISKGVWNIKHRAFEDNPNLTELTFEERGALDPGLAISANAFYGCNIAGEMVQPNFHITLFGNDWCSYPGFFENKITKFVGSDKGISLGYWTFEGNPLESIENLYPLCFEDGAFGKTKALKNVSFIPFEKYTDKSVTSVPAVAFQSGLLKSVELPAHFNSIAADAYKDNLGWIEGDSKVAVYRKDANGYVIDNAVADGDSFVINPALVTIEVTNQYGGTYDKEVLLKGTRKRTLSSGADDKADVTVNTVGNFADFKLGDSYTFTLETPGITLKSIDGADVAEGVTEHTVNVTGTTEVPYGDGYKLGYQKKVITLVVNDPNAVNPLLYLYIPDPELPVTPSNQNDVPPVTPASEEKPTVVEDLTIDGDETPQGSKEIEEDLDVESDEIPQGSKEIKKLGKKEKVEEMVEDLDIEGDEIPQGDTELGGERGKKTSKVQALLAKTGGQNVMIFQVVAVFAVLVLGYAVLSFFAARKKER